MYSQDPKWNAPGPKVVGDEAYDEWLNRERTGAHKAGPRVTGVNKAGPRVGGKETDAVFSFIAPELDRGGEEEADAIRDAAGEDGYLSIGDLKDLLDDAPETLDRLIAAEFGRADGVRKGALRRFLQEEQGRDEPRSRVVAGLEKALTSLD